MKRWMAWLGAVCAAGLMFSACGLSHITGGVRRGRRAAPYSISRGDGLYMVGEAAEAPSASRRGGRAPRFPQRLTVFPGAEGLYMLSPNGRELAFCPRYNALGIKPLCTRSIRQARGKTKAVCEDLAVFLRNWAIGRPFVFGVDGTLYYIQQNREAVRTDLYAYEKERVVWWRKMSYPFT